MALREHFSKTTGTHGLGRSPSLTRSSLNSIPHPLVMPRLSSLSGQTLHDVGLSSIVICQLLSRC
jgi:hypothetical protein